MDGEREDYSERELEPDDREYEAMTLDAARWRALLASDRIQIHGFARARTAEMHFEAAFWITYPEDGSKRTLSAATVLTDYADAAIAAGKG